MTLGISRIKARVVWRCEGAVLGFRAVVNEGARPLVVLLARRYAEIWKLKERNVR